LVGDIDTVTGDANALGTISVARIVSRNKMIGLEPLKMDLTVFPSYLAPWESI